MNVAEYKSLAAKPKRHKYGARKTVVDGITFDSAAEAKRYGELKALERAGEITRLELQKPFEIHVWGGAKIGKYIADFVYFRGQEYVIEDVKGIDTPLSKFKRNAVQAEYGVKIEIIRKQRVRAA